MNHIEYLQEYETRANEYPVAEYGFREALRDAWPKLAEVIQAAKTLRWGFTPEDLSPGAVRAMYEFDQAMNALEGEE